MRYRAILTIALAVLLSGAAMLGQLQPPSAPWRGAGPTPCVGSDGGVFQCPPALGVVAVRGGRMFDSKTGLGKYGIRHAIDPPS